MDKESHQGDESQSHLDPEAEHTIIGHFIGLIHQVVGEDPSSSVICRSWRVASSAATYFANFYGQQHQPHALLVYDPRVFMLAAIFLAAKVIHPFFSFLYIFLAF